MIDKDIIKLASNTSNVGLKNNYSHKISLKNSTCGDKITLELIADIKNDFITLKERSIKKNGKIPKRLSDFKKLLNSDNLNRFKCVFLPIDAVLKALKL